MTPKQVRIIVCGVAINLLLFAPVRVLDAQTVTIPGGETKSSKDAVEYFELVAQGLDKPSTAAIGDTSLTIRAPDGQASVYKRLPKYDTPDGEFIGYSSRELQQIIRWPVSGSGNMEIGQLRGGKIEFAPSRMTVRKMDVAFDESADVSRPVDGNSTTILPPAIPSKMIPPSQSLHSRESSTAGSLLNLPQPTPFHFGVGNERRQFLSLASQDRFQLIANPSDLASTWYLNPVGKDLVRLQQRVGDQWQAISVAAGGATAARDRRGSNGGFGNSQLGKRTGNQWVLPPNHGRPNRYPLQLSPIHGGIDQLWRIQSYRGGGYVFESMLYPGTCLTFPPAGGLFLQPIAIWNKMAGLGSD